MATFGEVRCRRGAWWVRKGRAELGTRGIGLRCGSCGQFGYVVRLVGGELRRGKGK